MAHELMAPSGFKERLVRRYERYLAADRPLSTQDGSLEEARWKSNVFDAIVPSVPQVIDSDEVQSSRQVTWRGVNQVICHNAHDTVSGDKLAPEFEDCETGARLRIVEYEGLKGTYHSGSLTTLPINIRLFDPLVKIPAQHWFYMWSHACCQFLGPTEPSTIEFTALHTAWKELADIPETWASWQWPIGQRIFVLQKQVEHRLRTAHIGRPNPCCKFGLF